MTKMVVYDGFCCQTWPLIAGVRVGRCGECGARPIGLPNTTRVVDVPNTQHAPKLVATVER